LDSGIEVGAHLHARPDEAAAKIAAAYRAGCRRFDMAMGGFGGCPFAQDTLVGNIATEAAVEELRRLGAVLPRLSPLTGLRTAAEEIEQRYGNSVQ
jgi:hydroxymethylglutaryl-CoA lyase